MLNVFHVSDAVTCGGRLFQVSCQAIYSKLPAAIVELIFTNRINQNVTYSVRSYKIRIDSPNTLVYSGSPLGLGVIRSCSCMELCSVSESVVHLSSTWKALSSRDVTTSCSSAPTQASTVAEVDLVRSVSLISCRITTVAQSARLSVLVPRQS